MKKKSWKKVMNAPIKPLKLDGTEFMVLTFVAIALILFLVWQLGMMPKFSSEVLGISTMR